MKNPNLRFWLLLILISFVLVSLSASAQEQGIRVYICVDMEGLSTAVSPWEVIGGESTPYQGQEGQDYERSRHLLTAEVNAAIQGAREAGATEFLVKEAHGGRGLRNIIPEELDPEAKLLRGFPVPGTMSAGIDRGFDAVFLIAMHARYGSKSTLAHNFFFADFRINDQVLTEGAFISLMAGLRGVPVVLVTGDNVVAEQIREVVGDIEAAVVKESLTSTAAITLHPSKAQALIRKHARKAIQRLSDFKPLRFSAPYKLEFTWPPGSPLKEHMNKLREVFPKLKDQPGDRFSLTTDSLEEISQFIDQTAILWGLGVVGPSN